MSDPKDRPEPVPDPLSEREREILRFVEDGLTNKEIARVLNISPQTVKNHIMSILRKLSDGTHRWPLLLAAPMR